jgi:hypothetical protein
VFSTTTLVFSTTTPVSIPRNFNLHIGSRSTEFTAVREINPALAGAARFAHGCRFANSAIAISDCFVWAAGFPESRDESHYSGDWRQAHSSKLRRSTACLT